MINDDLIKTASRKPERDKENTVPMKAGKNKFNYFQARGRSNKAKKKKSFRFLLDEQNKQQYN